MRQLSQNELYAGEGKMYGIVLVELPNGEQRVIKAFSGLSNGFSVVKGCVYPIFGREEVALAEAFSLAELETIKQEIITFKQLPEREQYQRLSAEFKHQLELINSRHSLSKQQRQEKRQQYHQTLIGENLEIALTQLETESCQQGIERKYLKLR
jgi:tRNA pseudouridine32 synthase/23S rRNA pseudouridine746 synthase